MILTELSENDIQLQIEETLALVKAAEIIKAVEIKVIREHLMWLEYLRLAKKASL